MADLCDELKARFLQAAPPEGPEDFLGALDVLGSNREAAAFFAGTSDRSSSDYRAALRRVQRYRAHRTGAREVRSPRREDLEKLIAAAEERVQLRQENLGGGEVTIRGLVTVSTDQRRRTIRGELSGDCREYIARLLAEDLCDEAVEAFEECFGQENGMGAIPSWDDVDQLAV